MNFLHFENLTYFLLFGSSKDPFFLSIDLLWFAYLEGLSYAKICENGFILCVIFFFLHLSFILIPQVLINLSVSKIFHQSGVSVENLIKVMLILFARESWKELKHMVDLSLCLLNLLAPFPHFDCASVLNHLVFADVLRILIRRALFTLVLFKPILSIILIVELNILWHWCKIKIQLGLRMLQC